MRKKLFSLALLIAFAAPLPLFAQTPFNWSIPGMSVGGTVISIIPCVVGALPALQVWIARPVTYLATPYIWILPTVPKAPVITRTELFGPPSRPGQYILGIGGLPSLCFIPSVPPVPLFGQLLHAIGTGNPASLSI